MTSSVSRGSIDDVLDRSNNPNEARLLFDFLVGLEDGLFALKYSSVNSGAQGIIEQHDLDDNGNVDVEEFLSYFRLQGKTEHAIWGRFMQVEDVFANKYVLRDGEQVTTPTRIPDGKTAYVSREDAQTLFIELLNKGLTFETKDKQTIDLDSLQAQEHISDEDVDRLRLATAQELLKIKFYEPSQEYVSVDDVLDRYIQKGKRMKKAPKIALRKSLRNENLLDDVQLYGKGQGWFETTTLNEKAHVTVEDANKLLREMFLKRRVYRGENGQSIDIGVNYLERTLKIDAIRLFDVDKTDNSLFIPTPHESEVKVFSLGKLLEGYLPPAEYRKAADGNKGPRYNLIVRVISETITGKRTTEIEGTKLKIYNGEGRSYTNAPEKLHNVPFCFFSGAYVTQADHTAICRQLLMEKYDGVKLRPAGTYSDKNSVSLPVPEELRPESIAEPRQAEFDLQEPRNLIRDPAADKLYQRPAGQRPKSRARREADKLFKI